MNDYSRSSKISIKELYANEMAHSIEVCFNTKQDQGAKNCWSILETGSANTATIKPV